MAKLVALGGDRKKAYLTFQEFFQSLGTEVNAWGKPVAALLGAYTAQRELQIAAIGGKDSMSGTFENLTVPPTLVSFAVVTEKAKNVISPEFKAAGDAVILLDVPHDDDDVIDWVIFKDQCDFLHEQILSGKVKAARAVGQGGVAAALAQMAFGNGIGFMTAADIAAADLFALRYGAFVVETDCETAKTWTAHAYRTVVATTTTTDAAIVGNVHIALDELLQAWEKPLAKIFPVQSTAVTGSAELPVFTTYGPKRSESFGKPRVFIPVCPGTNCEYDSAAAFEAAGAVTDTFVLRNETPQALMTSIAEMEKRIARAQIIMFPAVSVPVMNRKVQVNLLLPSSVIPFLPKRWKTSFINGTVWSSGFATVFRRSLNWASCRTAIFSLLMRTARPLHIIQSAVIFRVWSIQRSYPLCPPGSVMPRRVIYTRLPFHTAKGALLLQWNRFMNLPLRGRLQHNMLLPTGRRHTTVCIILTSPSWL
ncbi:hypothetical protein HMPREF0080_01618 [Anaeroglobus geminatus F0357]|uniref:Uncharacterized protein n=1 Tax=Anaeroglobus geminatus F0357 TaxID=861450 RepID=G9YIX4_9FIRM|nr:hypothetical protein HMPREF0080_01618 [Anaeroglobus geminatus F0357]